jgi:hypothetical protein
MLLKETLAAEAPETILESLEVKSEEESGRYGYLGSPTIQINGLDIDKERRKDSPYYGCRIYRSAGGLSGIPPKSMVVEAIREAKADSDNHCGKSSQEIPSKA